MSKYSYVRTHYITNGTITVYASFTGVIVALDAQVLNDPIKCEGETAYEALDVLHIQVEMIRCEVHHFYGKVSAAGGFINKEAARKEYLQYRQLLEDVYEVKTQYTSHRR